MMEEKCVACGEEVAEGFAMGRLCYHCIEKAVVSVIKEIEKKKEGSTYETPVQYMTNGNPITHLIRFDYGEIEVVLYHKAVPGTQEELIIESALMEAFLRGLELPKEQFFHECYPVPEYDKE